jgi:hypothetical protein
LCCEDKFGRHPEYGEQRDEQDSVWGREIDFDSNHNSSSRESFLCTFEMLESNKKMLVWQQLNLGQQQRRDLRSER